MYLSRLSPEMREEFFDVIRNAIDQPISTNSMIYGQHHEKRDKFRVTKSRSKKKGFKSVCAAKRPLNSFIAFRSYYTVIFGQFQQKEISGFLTMLWQGDYFQAKWTIIARAYSEIRDQVGKVQPETPLQPICTDHDLD